MTPIHDLAFGLLDGELPESSAQQLRDAVRTDPAAESEFRSLLELESLLRGESARDVVDATMRRIATEQERRIERAVMRTVEGVAPQSDERGSDALRRTAEQESAARERRRGNRFGRGAVLAWSLFAVVSVWAAWQQFGPRPQVSAPAAAVLDDSEVGPVVVRCTTDAFVADRQGVRTPAEIGRVMRSGESVGSEAPDGAIDLRYADGTRVALGGTSELVVATGPRGGKELDLRNGSLAADIVPQPAARPLRIVTPQAALRATGSRLEVVAAREQGTRLDLKAGDAEVVRGNDEPMPLEPGTVAFVPENRTQPVSVAMRRPIASGPVREFRAPGLVALDFASDGRTLHGATDWQVARIDAGQRVELVPVASRRSHCSFQSQDRNLLAFADTERGRTVLWDAGGLREVGARRWHGDPPDLRGRFVRAVSATGRWLVSTASDGRVPRCELHRIATGETLPIERPIVLSAFAASPDGRRLAVGHSDLGLRRNAVELIDAETTASLAVLPVRTIHPLALRFSADAVRVAVGLVGEIQVWDAVRRERIATIGDLIVPVLLLSLSPDGRTLAARTHTETVELWDVESETSLGAIAIGGSPRDLHFSPDGTVLLVLDRSGRATEWDLRNLRRAAEVGPHGPDPNDVPGT